MFHHSDSGEGGEGGEESIEDFEGAGGSADGSCKGSESGVGSECSETSGRRKHTHTDRTVSTPGTGAGAGAGVGTVVPRRVARVRTAASPPLGYMECGQCNVSRPTTAAHCYECGVCVDQLDHHCPVSTLVAVGVKETSAECCLMSVSLDCYMCDFCHFCVYVCCLCLLSVSMCAWVIQCV